MKVVQTKIPGLYVIELQPIGDHRGYFERFYDIHILAEQTGINNTIKQINHSYSAQAGTIRGMHFQYAPHAEDKIVYCVRGQIFDVAVDIRQNSPTFLQWHGEVLSHDNHRAFIVPKGFAHGFQTMSDDIEIVYLMSEFYHKECEAGLRFNDPAVGIQWPLPCQNISQRDQEHPVVNHNFKGVVL